MGIILRQIKGSELTFAEVDGNFQSLFYSASFIGSTLNFYTWENNLSQSFNLATIPGFGGIEVQRTGSVIVPSATTMNFTGNGLTVTNVNGVATVEFTGAGGGDTYTLLAGPKTGSSIPLNLDAAVGADSTVNLTEGTGITLTQTSATEITIDSTGGGGTYSNPTPTPLNFPSDDDPNIPAGSTFVSQSLTEMMDQMLYPELFPTLTNPSNTFSLSPSGLREIAEVITTVTLTSGFSKGSINPAYTTTGFRSGDPNQYNYGGSGVVDIPSTSLNNTTTATNYVVILGNQSWTSAVQYDAGPQPLSSKGNNFNSPLSAGTTGTITRSITGVYPPFATSVSLGTLTKQSLQTMTSLIQVSLVTEAGGAGVKQKVDIPNAFSSITGLQQFNTLSNTWDAINLATFTTSAVTQTIQGQTVNYTRYTHNGSTIGARQLRFLT
jgi:hypothetical protein|tara:strand:+ start:5775 stop:7085 length:1311 start_codon:yes stop_codon:yes gene_type:complete